MAKNYSVSFDIRGSLDGSLLSAIQSAQNALKGLNQTARAASNASKLTGLAGVGQSLNAIQQAANKFRELKKASVETQQALANAQKEAQRLGREYSQNHQKQIQDLNRQKIALKDLKDAQESANKALEQHRAGWKHFRDERAEIKAQLKDLGAKSRKIPREFLGTRQGQEISKLLTRLSENKKALEAQRQKFREARDEAQKYAKQIRETQNAIKNQERLAAQGSQEFNAARANVQNLKASLQSQLEALQRLRSQLGSAGFNTSHFAASERQLQSEIDRVNQSLQRQQQLLQARQNFNAAAGDLGLASAGMMGAVYTAQQVAQPFATAIDKAIQFEHTMSTLESISQMDLIKAGDTAQVEANMARLTAQAKELGAKTIFKAQEIGEAQVYIARTGWDTDAIEKSIPSILKLAAANKMDIEPTADIVTNVMTAFGHGVDQIERDTDVFAYTVTHSNQTLSQFGEAMKYAAPVAKLFGASIEETAMMTKFMGDAGIQSSMAGTSMRQTMLRLTAPPKKASKAMDELGVSTSDATKAWNEAQEVAASYGVTLDSTLGAGRQFISIMEQIDRGFVGKSDREKLAAVSAITGINAVSGAANVFGAGAKQAKNFTELLENCRGALEQTYSVMTDDTFGAQKSFESAWEAVQLSFGEALLGITRAGYEIFAPILTGISQFIDRNPAVVQAAAGIAAALSGIIVSAAAVKLAFAGWKFIGDAITLVQTSLAGLGEGAILGGLIGRLGRLRTALFGLGGAATLGGWSAMFTAIATSARTATTAVTRFFASLSLSSVVNGAVGALRSLGTAILGAARAAMMFAFSPVGVALMALALAGIYCYQNWDKVAPVLSMIADIVTGALAPAFNQIKAAIEGFASSGGFAALQSIVTSLANTVGGKLVKAFMVLLAVAASVIAGLIQLFADLITIVIDFGTGLSEAFAKIKNGEVMGALDALSEAGKKVSADISKLGDHTFDSFIQGAKNVENVLKALDMPKLPTKKVTARHRVEFDESGQAHESTPIDTTTTQAALDAVGDSAQNAATNMDGVQQATDVLSQIPASIQPATDAISQIPASIQPTTDAISQIPASIQPTTDALAQIPASLQPTTEALAQIPASIQPTTDALAQIPASIQPTTEALAQIPASIQPTIDAIGQVPEALTTAVSTISDALIQLGTEALTAATQLQTDTVALQMFGAATVTDTVALQMLGAAALTTGAALQTLGASALGAVGGITSLGTAASSAASSVSGLGSAAQSACAQLAAAGASAAAQVSAAASSIKVGHNAEGGIYQRGAFLTTFAEKSPEAAIPINHTKRAEQLWTQTGQLLGILPQQTNYANEINQATPQNNSAFNGDISTQISKMPKLATTMQPTIERQSQETKETLWQKAGRILGILPKDLPKIEPQINRIPRLPGQATIPKLSPLNLPETMPPTFPTIPPDIKPQIRRMPRGLKMPRINFPTMTPPTFPEERPMPRLSIPQGGGDLPPINVTIHVTINGNADEQTVRRGIEAALPATQRSFAEELALHRREALRRSFA